MMNIALLTREYVTQPGHSGGLATYLHRLASALRDGGHAPEVFVFTPGPEARFSHDDILVHRVGRWPRPHLMLRKLLQPGQDRRHAFTHRWCQQLEFTAPALALARALEARHRLVRFPLIQSQDFLVPGLRVPRRAGRVHLVRCSTAADLYNEADADWTCWQQVRVGYELQVLRGADRCYAPSRFVAAHFAQSHGIQMSVVRPPAFVEKPSGSALSLSLPQRFLLYFGQLLPKKGILVLAEALKIAWQTDPSVAMVWAGKCWDAELLPRCQNSWGAQADRVQITGALSRPEVYALLQRAEAAVIPSLVDNLPNTVIESLLRGIPVIGTRGSSIDELVEEGVTGHLVPIGDASALAEAMLRIWRRRSPVPRRFHWKSPVQQEMEPKRAVANLLRFAGLLDSE